MKSLKDRVSLLEKQLQEQKEEYEQKLFQLQLELMTLKQGQQPEDSQQDSREEGKA